MSGLKKYTVKKGHHNFKPNKFKLFTSNVLKIKGYFEKSCLYEFGDVDDYDINKLAGFSTSFHHQIQSIRAGWRPSKMTPGSIEILTYTYDHKTSISNLFHALSGDLHRQIDERIILTVKPYEEFNLLLTVSPESFDFVAWSETTQAGSETIVQFPKKNKSFFLHYLLTPFFGGNKKAPHDMILYLSMKS